jgi:hypothetical protein
LISKDGEELVASLEFDFDEVSKVAHKAQYFELKNQLNRKV